MAVYIVAIERLEIWSISQCFTAPGVVGQPAMVFLSTCLVASVSGLQPLIPCCIFKHIPAHYPLFSQGFLSCLVARAQNMARRKGISGGQSQAASHEQCILSTLPRQAGRPQFNSLAGLAGGLMRNECFISRPKLLHLQD